MTAFLKTACALAGIAVVSVSAFSVNKQRAVDIIVSELRPEADKVDVVVSELRPEADKVDVVVPELKPEVDEADVVVPEIRPEAEAAAEPPVDIIMSERRPDNETLVDIAPIEPYVEPPIDPPGGYIMPRPQPNDSAKYAGVPSLPGFRAGSPNEIPFDPTKLFGQKLELSYTAAPVSAAFLAEISKLTPVEFEHLGMGFNFSTVGEYVLYRTDDSNRGPSKIKIDAPDGSTQTLIESAYGIADMFLLDEETLCIEFVTMFDTGGFTGQHYSLNLRTGVVTKANYAPTGFWPNSYTVVYRRHLYKFDFWNDAKLGFVFEILLQNKNGEFVQMVECAAEYVFHMDSIYYLSKERTELHKISLDGEDRALLHEFTAPVQNISITGDMLFYSDKTGRDGIHIDAADEVPMYSPPKEFYRYSLNADNVLEYTSDTGEKIPLISNFIGDYLYIVNDWVYFRVFSYDDVGTYNILWRIKTDGTELTLLN